MAKKDKKAGGEAKKGARKLTVKKQRIRDLGPLPGKDVVGGAEPIGALERKTWK